MLHVLAIVSAVVAQNTTEIWPQAGTSTTVVTTTTTTIMTTTKTTIAPYKGDEVNADAVIVLGRMLMKIAAVQLLGFLAKSSELMPASTEWGIGAYLGRIALPSALFGAIARLSAETMDPIIIGAVLVASLIIFFLAGGLALLLLDRSKDGTGKVLKMVGLFGLFVTMGDE